MSAPSTDVWHRYTSGTADLSNLGSRVHVWRARLERLSSSVPDNLSEDEIARADRFYRAEDRDRFTTARSILRCVLADCLGLDETPKGRSLRFFYGPAGKPFLADDPDLRFSISHAGRLVAIAVTRAGEVGVDIENERPMPTMDSIARLVFNDAEQAAMMGCPIERRPQVFYSIWTRKEALLKAMGVGLPALKDPNAASLARDAANWFVTNLPHLDDYVGSIARPRRAHGLKLWSWHNAVGLRASERRKSPRPAPGPRPALHAFEVRL